jgi:hypothetical protein
LTTLARRWVKLSSMANLEEDLDKPGAAPDGDVHFTSSTPGVRRRHAAYILVGSSSGSSSGNKRLGNSRRRPATWDLHDSPNTCYIECIFT